MAMSISFAMISYTLNFFLVLVFVTTMFVATDLSSTATGLQYKIYVAKPGVGIRC